MIQTPPAEALLLYEALLHAPWGKGGDCVILPLQAWVTLLVGSQDPEPKKHVINLEVSWSLGNKNVDPGSGDHPDPWDVESSAFALKR